jgi:hypothetical protein
MQQLEPDRRTFLLDALSSSWTGAEGGAGESKI